jgi:hypothetical protein
MITLKSGKLGSCKLRSKYKKENRYALKPGGKSMVLVGGFPWRSAMANINDAIDSSEITPYIYTIKNK